jgi:hypothetical protein
VAGLREYGNDYPSFKTLDLLEKLRNYQIFKEDLSA